MTKWFHVHLWAVGNPLKLKPNNEELSMQSDNEFCLYHCYDNFLIRLHWNSIFAPLNLAYLFLLVSFSTKISLNCSKLNTYGECVTTLLVMRLFIMSLCKITDGTSLTYTDNHTHILTSKQPHTVTSSPKLQYLKDSLLSRTDNWPCVYSNAMPVETWLQCSTSYHKHGYGYEVDHL